MSSNETVQAYFTEMEKYNGTSMAFTLTSEFFGIEEDELESWIITE